VVNVSQVFTIDKSELTERIGTLSGKRVLEIIAGMKLVIEPRG
jgi:mRNA interferase MazF